jgi:TonB family protein
MNSWTDDGKSWEGRTVDGKFPLRQWLGSSGQSAVFLTEQSGIGSGKAAIKLIPAELFSAGSISEADQLARWAETSKLSHPHLIRLFQSGRGQIDDTRFLYVVMEYAEENLAQILPQRGLTPEEVKEMLPPTVEVLSFLHQAGFAHGHIRPSNILAVDNQLKISSDGLRKAGELDKQTPSAYVAPETASTGPSPAADVWSVGVTVISVLTQREPVLQKGTPVAIPPIPQPFFGIAERCLRLDPRERCTMDDILGKPKVQEPLPAKAAEPELVRHSKTWLLLPVMASIIVLAILLGRRSHQPPILPPDTHPAEAPAAVDVPSQSAAPFNQKTISTQTGIAHGRVVQEVSPDVSAGARRTITGHVKVSVQVSVDPSGNVSQAKLASPGPSRYFANQALAAARRWKFVPPQSNGQPVPSEWMLRFQFGRTSTQISPTETKP